MRDPERPRVQIDALHPDGRALRIRAWEQGNDRVTVSVQVGHFGAEPVENRYLERLREVMAGDPMPQRDKTFEYPVNAEDGGGGGNDE